MKSLRVSPVYRCIGLCDADLLDNGTRHPNLVLMKIAGFLSDNHILFELILDPKTDLNRYDHVFMSRVFTFTHLPEFYRVSGKLVGISINLCKSIQKELFINDTP